MQLPSYVPSPSELELLDEILRRVARTRLSPPDADDFVQSAQVKMLERHYEVFTQFAGRSSLRTYLTVVVTRLLLDWRNSAHGKWRPSAAAAQMGPHAMVMDRLINRDGWSADEAIEVYRAGGHTPDAATLRSLADQLPRRARMRRVTVDALEDQAKHFADPIAEEEQRQRRRRASRVLATALHQLSSEDRWLIRERYLRRCSVRDIAHAICADEKQLYRRFDRLRRGLRCALERGGITASEIKMA